MGYRFNEIYDRLVLDGKIVHKGYNTPFTACGCDDRLWDDVNDGSGGDEDILEAARRAGRVDVV
jgi:hypothetical protein